MIEKTDVLYSSVFCIFSFSYTPSLRREEQHKIIIITTTTTKAEHRLVLVFLVVEHQQNLNSSLTRDEGKKIITHYIYTHSNFQIHRSTYNTRDIAQ